MIESNQIIKGDCLEVLGGFPNECIDLIYLDPPFFSGKNFDIVWDNGSELSVYTDSKMYWAEQPVDREAIENEVDVLIKAGLVTDREGAIKKLIEKKQGDIRSGGIEGYLGYMRPRLRELRRVLKKTGSIYLHCDHHANAHLRILMDNMFGENNFQNEIIWQRTPNLKGSQFKARRYGVWSDTIFFYAKSKKYSFELSRIRVPLTEEELRKKYRRKDEKGGFLSIPILRSAGMGERPNLAYEYNGFKPEKWGWKISKAVLIEIDERGDLGWSKNGKPFRKRRPIEDRGKPISNIWNDLGHIGTNERLGYPTQKPESLLERIINASSNEGDVVLDPFVGGGTTLVAAERLGRKWIGIDVSPTACNMCVKNFKRYGLNDENVKVVNFIPEIESYIEKTLARLKSMDWSEFEQWVREELDFKWTSRCRKLGIDGIKPDEFLEVKKWKTPVGQATVDRLAGKMERGGVKKGIVVAENFTSGAFRASDSFKEKGIDIKIRFVRDLVA